MRSSTRRPSLLTPERIESIVKATAVGVANSLAAEGAGVSRATLARWTARGRNATQAREDGEPANAADDVYVELYRRVNSARGADGRPGHRAGSAGGRREPGSRGTRAHLQRPVTGLDVEELQTRYLRPDRRAAAWWLLLTERQMFGRAGFALLRKRVLLAH
ncbi:hypothetical protein [Streptomyces virginiae]|uniref:hypothetical protein n=1 Tax=Streptomyces virginiae TaxID=1961 RepID=UPI000525727F|nr:hypothetical protein [Streptomyces virginiae]